MTCGDGDKLYRSGVGCTASTVVNDTYPDAIGAAQQSGTAGSTVLVSTRN